MNKNILNYIEECEAWKVGIKNLHWSADNLSQHELCDDIADEISNFEDLVSEVEQSISGKIKLNGFTPKSYKITSLKSFVEDVISVSQSFLKKLEGMGEKYVGIKSECETFIGTMQRKLYLVNFTLKEELKKRLRDKINESRPINMANATDSRTFMGRKPNRIIEGYRKEENIKTVFPGTKPTSDGGILKRLEAISSSKNGQFNSRTFDSMDDAFEFFQRNLERVGNLEYNGTVDDILIVSLNADNGKTYKGMIDFIEVGDGKYKASIKFSNLGKESEFNEDFENNDYNDLRVENKQIKLTEAELKQVVKEAAMKILSETPLNYDVDNFSGRWNKNMPDNDEDWALAISNASGDYLDDPFNPPNNWDDDDWVDGDKDMETDYSWDLHDWKPDYSSQIDREISRRNDKTNWTDRELRHGGRVMDKYVNGKYDGEDVGDAWDDLHYESKKPMKVTESELKVIIKEAAMKLIREYGENVRNFVKRTHGAGKIKTGNPIKDKELRDKWLERKRKKETKGIAKQTDESSSIEIKPENKGKFTATKKATGKSTEELTHSKNPLTRKRANFAKMAKRHWKPLKESDYMDDGNLESQYGKNPDSMWTYGTNLNPSVVDGLEPNQVRHAGNGNIKNDNNASWDYFDAVSNGADMKMRNRLDADYRERTNNSPFNGIRKRMDMAMAFPRQTPNERFKQDLDKQWKDTQDIEKYSRQADSRPLHRKGSLNRA